MKWTNKDRAGIVPSFFNDAVPLRAYDQLERSEATFEVVADMAVVSRVPMSNTILVSFREGHVEEVFAFEANATLHAGSITREELILFELGYLAVINSAGLYAVYRVQTQ